jgi:hypothetical protein
MLQIRNHPYTINAILMVQNDPLYSVLKENVVNNKMREIILKFFRIIWSNSMRDAVFALMGLVLKCIDYFTTPIGLGARKILAHTTDGQDMPHGHAF